MTRPSLVIRQATADEIDTVMDLLKQRIDWLRSRGMDQWSTWRKWDTKIPASVEDGNVWLLVDGDDPIGTITLEYAADLDFWTEEEAAEPAAYLSKLAIRLDHAGGELGALLLDWASEYAHRRGYLYLRLDAWKTNEQLHAYYANRGWTYLRTADVPHRNSGALFQRQAVRMDRVTAGRIRQVPPLPTMPADRQSGYAGGDAGGPDHGNWAPDHTHRGGVTVVETWSPAPRPAMFVDWLRYRVVERDGSWVLTSQEDSRGLPVVDAAWPLSSGTDYVISHEGEHPDCRMVITEVPAAS